jgi:hypothetical protein
MFPKVAVNAVPLPPTRTPPGAVLNVRLSAFAAVPLNSTPAITTNIATRHCKRVHHWANKSE